jgi:hypothetical protein
MPPHEPPQNPHNHTDPAPNRNDQGCTTPVRESELTAVDAGLPGYRKTLLSDLCCWDTFLAISTLWS